MYTPAASQQIAGTAASFTYRDDAGDPRTVELYVRVPIAISAVLPVVIWSPAAGGTKVPPDVMSKWSETTARSGYLSISVAHGERSNVDRASLCLSQGVDTPRECFQFDPVNWDWPNDLREVVSWLDRVNQSGPPEFRGRIDMRRIAVAGFADGSSGALSLAGAKRLLTTQDFESADDFTDQRPIAFVALSPQGPVLEGFFDTEPQRPVTSWTPIERPVLLITGAGDNNCRYVSAGCADGDTPSRRRIPFELMPAGNKYEMYADSVRISHEFIGTLDTSACVASGVAQTECNDFDAWLRSAVIAFLDANVRGIPSANTWLKSGLIGPASNRTVMWSSK